MTYEKLRERLALLLAFAITAAPGLSLQAESAPLGKVVPRGLAELNHTRLRAEATVYAGDRVSTPGEGLALILLAQGSQIYVGPASAVEAQSAEAGMVAGLNRGTLLARSEEGQVVSVWAANLLMTPESSPALYQVELTEAGAVVAARRGAVRVEGSNRTLSVPAGKAMRFEVAASAQEPEPRGAEAGAGLSGRKKAVIVLVIAAGVATAIAVPLALDEDEEEVVSPSVP